MKFKIWCLAYIKPLQWWYKYKIRKINKRLEKENKQYRIAPWITITSDELVTNIAPPKLVNTRYALINDEEIVEFKINVETYKK